MGMNMKMHKASSHRDKIVREADLFQRRAKTILAIDEAGRGPLAGPLVVAGLLLTRKTLALLPALGVDDSKRLTPAVREKIFKKIKVLRFRHQVVRRSAHWIDRHGIQTAWHEAITELIKRFRPTISLIDGRKTFTPPGRVEFWIKGDQRLYSIGAASIIAKVTRDRLMCRLAKKYPKYQFEQHKGYGTRKHIALIKRHGLSVVHRKTFCKFFIKNKQGGE